MPRKRKYTPLPPGPDDGIYPEDMPMPIIQNIVSTAKIVSTIMPMDLYTICDIMPGSVYDRRKFAAMTVRLGSPSCTLLLFSSGRLVVTGGRRWYDGVLSCLCVSAMLREMLAGVDFWLKDCKVENIVANVEIPVGAGCLDLDAIYARLNLHCMFTPECFPGLIFRPEASPVVLLCFYSGRIVITGGRSNRDVCEGWRRLWPTIRVFVTERPTEHALRNYSASRTKRASALSLAEIQRKARKLLSVNDPARAEFLREAIDGLHVETSPEESPPAGPAPDPVVATMEEEEEEDRAAHDPRRETVGGCACCRRWLEEQARKRRAWFDEEVRKRNVRGCRGPRRWVETCAEVLL